MPEHAAVERRIVSVLFADLVGFTTLSERLDPEDVATVQDAYFSAVRDTIQRYGGVLEKFIGDAAMAVFGVPRARDDDAERAVRAGLALVAAVENLGARLGEEAGTLQLRVGVNTGEVVHATSGPDAGRVTGDTVNTAARFQTAAVPGTVLVGELTALAIGETIDLAEAAPLSLKGKADPVRARRVVGVRTAPSRDAALGSLRAPLLGRGEDLARVEAVERGRITIVAPPGVGKSRLVAELAARATASGSCVLRARCRPQAAGPYEVVAELLAAAGAERLDELLDHADVPAARRAFLEREVRALRQPAGAGESTVKDVAAERETRFEAWSDALDLLAEQKPATWIVEDVHWAGGDLLAFLEHASRGGRRIACTARPSILETASEWVAAGQVVELRSLPPTDASALVHALVGDALPDALVASVAERSDGNPLFIEELLRTWISVGTLEADGDAWRLTIAPSEIALPATVQAIYAAQLDDLPTNARLVARRASVAGRRFADAALEPLELADRRDGLGVLRRRDFVAGPEPDTIAGEVYTYRHALLRDAGYASLARAERARLHTALARWLEETAGDRTDAVAEAIAEHLARALESLPAIGTAAETDRGELSAAAASWYERAAEASLRLAAHEAAVAQLQRAIELTDPEATLTIAGRRLRRGQILADAADLDAGIDEITAALDAFAVDLPRTAEAYGRAVYTLGVAFMQQVRFPEAESLTADALERLPFGTPAHVRLMALHAWSKGAQGRDEGAVEEADEARELADGLDDPHLLVQVLDHQTATHDELRGPDPAAWAELQARASAIGQWRQAVIAARISGLFAADTDPRAGLDRIADAAELALAHGMTEQGGWCELARCETLFVLGEWDAAVEVGRRAIELSERYGYVRLGFRTWMVLLPIAAATRDAELAEPYRGWWSGARANFPSTPSPYGTVLNQAANVWLARAAEEAVPVPDDVIEHMVPMSNPHFVAAIEDITAAWLEAGRLDLARRVTQRPVDDDHTPLMRASASLIDAWVARAEGNPEDAARHANAALEHAAPIEAAWWLRRAGDVLAAP